MDAGNCRPSSNHRTAEISRSQIFTESPPLRPADGIRILEDPGRIQTNDSDGKLRRNHAPRISIVFSVTGTTFTRLTKKVLGLKNYGGHIGIP